MDKSLATFRASIRAAVRGIFSGDIDALSGADALFSAIRRGFTQAWYEGAKQAGIKPDELTIEELKKLGEMIGDNNQYIGNFVTWIVELKASGGSLESAFSRADMWVSRYNQVVTTAREMAGLDQKEIWIINPLKEHCCDCLRLSNRVYRNSVWHKYNIQPQSPLLSCFGGHCGCHREKTDLPITKGRPPALRGPGGCGKAGKKKDVDLSRYPN